MMLDRVIYELTNLKKIIITFLVVIIVLYVVGLMLSYKFKFNRNKIRIFSVLYGLSPLQQIVLSIAITRFVYVAYFVVDYKTFGMKFLPALIAMSLAIVLLQKEITSIPGSIISSIGVYAIIYMESSLLAFYNGVEEYWLALAMAILLGLFCFLYNVYNLISSYNHLVSKPYKNSNLYESLKDVRKIKWLS